MAISLYKIKKWMDMLNGNSVHHVNQDEGKCYSKDEIKGYYNNLTEKVTRFGLSGNEVPKSSVDTGETIYFSIEIFQYGLASYDLFLMFSDQSMLEKTIACAEWAVGNQQTDGSWVTFEYENKAHPYSSMAQGEGISLLARAFAATGEEKYKVATDKALEFMLKPVEEGGTTKYDGNDIYFLECTHDPLILNGWIFSLWGVLDYWKLTKNEQVKDVLGRTLATMERRLPYFDMGYWSMYEDGKRICSPFYHKLHIAQLNVMYDLTGNAVFKAYADKWERYLNSWWNRNRAFAKKAIQKVFE
ncbi:MAG: hypothetical protein BWY74_04005 [Firmicutes bacterium ADurb.Bin419]|nr:MAG: hypothetical protein BWY74_04005 [Firmicutes bacterium ADurb.Bin419]